MKDVNCKIGNDFMKCLCGLGWGDSNSRPSPDTTTVGKSNNSIYLTKTNIMPKIKNHHQTCE